MKKNNVKKITVTALFCALAFLMTFIFRFKVGFLTFDMKDAILSGKSFADDADIEKHAAWFDAFRDSYTFTEENTEDIIKLEIGKTFVRVLRDAGVYNDTPEGRKYFGRFIDYCNG